MQARGPETQSHPGIHEIESQANEQPKEQTPKEHAEGWTGPPVSSMLEEAMNNSLHEKAYR